MRHTISLFQNSHMMISGINTVLEQAIVR